MWLNAKYYLLHSKTNYGLVYLAATLVHNKLHYITKQIFVLVLSQSSPKGHADSHIQLTPTTKRNNERALRRFNKFPVQVEERVLVVCVTTFENGLQAGPLKLIYGTSPHPQNYGITQAMFLWICFWGEQQCDEQGGQIVVDFNEEGAWILDLWPDMGKSRLLDHTTTEFWFPWDKTT